MKHLINFYLIVFVFFHLFGCEKRPKEFEEINWGKLRYVQTKTNIRAERNRNSKVVGILNPDQRVKVDFLNDNWYAVFRVEEENRDENNSLGYVYVSLLKSNPQYDFRKTRWGWNKTQVMKSEIGRGTYLEKFDKKNNVEILIYTDTLEDFPNLSCNVWYFFLKGELIIGEYIFSFNSKYDFGSAYWCLSYYVSMRINLQKKYRKLKWPESQYYLSKEKRETPTSYPYENEVFPFYEQIWKDEKYKKDPHHWDWAVRYGDLKLVSEYVTPRTNISLKVGTGKDQLPHIYIYYENANEDLFTIFAVYGSLKDEEEKKERNIPGQL